jgi:hypothetical protein
MFALEPGRERAFISTYQSLGYVKNNKLIVLSPQQKLDTYQVNLDGELQRQEGNDAALTREAIAWYQSASYAFSNGLMQ